MIRFNIFNSVTDCEYKDIEFNNEKVSSDGTIRTNVSLIYASNAVGKSTFSSIVERHFNNIEQVENKFTGIKSRLDVIKNDNNIMKAVRYDRNFASKSADLYRNELVISPKNAFEIVNAKKLVDENTLEILDAYKKSEIYKQLVLFQNDKVKKTKLSKLILKKFNDTHAQEIVRVLTDNLSDKKINCYSYEVDELIDFSLSPLDFLIFCQTANDDIFSMIKENFPEIDEVDSHFYQELINYLTDNKGKVLNELCIMCGKTMMTDEIINERILVLKKKLEDYNKKIESNDFFKKLKEFNDGQFFSQMFKSFQEDLRNKEKNDLFISLSNIGKKLENIDVKQIINNSIDCIIDKVRNEKNIFALLESRDKLSSQLKKLSDDNKDTINEETKEKFVSNLDNFKFRYFDKMKVVLDKESNAIIISFDDMNMGNLFSDVLSESEKSILSFSLFKAIINENDDTIVVVDDPVDSHDQRNKWFILNNIIELSSNSKNTIIIMTHDLSLSKTLNQIDNNISFTNFILSRKSLDIISGPSLFFSDIYDFIFEVFSKIQSSQCNNNEKYFLPLAFLSRYLSKNQYKLLNEIDVWHSPTSILDPATITRKETKVIGFKDISDKFVHYNSSVDSDSLLNNIEKILKVRRISTSKPAYFINSIATDLLIESIIADIGDREQFDKEITKIMSAVLIRNILEKKIIAGITITTEKMFSDYAKTYKAINGNNDIYAFYLKNKAMVDEFAHLESGIDALLTYEIDYVIEQLTLIKNL